MNKGFTLIEVIIYIALFSLLMGTAFVTAFQMINSSSKLSIKNTIQEEGNFVLRKIDWALTGVQSVSSPSAGNITSETLTVTKHDGNTITIRGTSGTPLKIEIKESSDGNTFLPITTENVIVNPSSILFRYIPATGSGPVGITGTFMLNGTPFTITKYFRK